MHQALYRKWRPKSFDDVCGQEHITSVLRYEIANATPNHAYLFCGSRGTGKTTCAKIMAKAVNCLSPENGNPCGRCEACLAIESGTVTDVLEMDAASNNKVENIRDIRDEVVYAPSALKYRVYIVDEVHMLTTSAFNALLKTLEEPPAHVIFILATTELHKLPATIVSRCQRFDFRRIAVPVLAARLSHIATAEGIKLLPDAAERIARLAQGGMRDAISLLELCAGTRETITVATVDDMMGSSGRAETVALLRAVLEKDYEAIFASVADAVAGARDLSVYWQDLIAAYRDMLVIKTIEKDAARYLDLTDAEHEELSALAANVSKATLLAHCHLLEETLLAMQGANESKRMLVELTLVRMCDPMLDTSPEGLLRRIERLEDGFVPTTAAPRAEKQTAAPAAPAAAPKATAGEPKPTVVAPKQAAAPAAPSAPQRMRDFSSCVERVRRNDTMAGSFLEMGTAYLDSSGRVILRFTAQLPVTMLEKGSARDLVRGAISAQLQREVPDSALIFEVVAPTAEKADTVLDDLMQSAKA